jgi:hypothetical protein
MTREQIAIIVMLKRRRENIFAFLPLFVSIYVNDVNETNNLLIDIICFSTIIVKLALLLYPI